MKFEFVDDFDGSRYEFVILSFTLVIRKYNPQNNFEWGWIVPIHNGKIIWRNDEWLYITPQTKDYIDRIVKLKAFW